MVKKKKGSDLVMVALQTKALTANPRNTGGCQMKKPGKMRTKEKGKKKHNSQQNDTFKPENSIVLNFEL